MGCAKSGMSTDLASLSSHINTNIQVKSVLQYQINQLKNIVEQKKSYPLITEVKDEQLTIIKLSKGIKDTETLLNSIKSSRDENFVALEDIYLRLESTLNDKTNECNSIEQEVLQQQEYLTKLQERMNELNEEITRINTGIQEFQNAEKTKLGHIIDF